MKVTLTAERVYMKIKIPSILLAVAQLAAFAHCAMAQGLSAHIKPLLGLKALYVLVENPSQEAKRINLTTEDMQRVVETKLKMAGIKVLSTEESLRAAGAPFMSVNIGIRSRDAILFGDITIGVYELACLQSDTTNCGGFITWQTSGIFTTKAKDAAPWLQDKLNETMDIFLHDYFAANPRAEPIPTIPNKKNKHGGHR
jgi:hypothetical protein